MKWHCVWGIILRYLYLFKHNLDRQSDAFYWPTVDLLLWGLTVSYAAGASGNTQRIVWVVISGLLLWLIVWRAQYEITVNILEELWNKNLINIFVAPIMFKEWVAAFMALGVMKGFLSCGFAAVVAFFLYKVKLVTFGIYLVPFISLLLMTGWAVGCFVGGLILRFGTRIQNFAWSMAFVIVPFSAVYYPVSILPSWAQSISALIPTSYIFEGARSVLAGDGLDVRTLGISFLLNAVYLTLAILFMRSSFKRLLEKGLVKAY